MTGEASSGGTKGGDLPATAKELRQAFIARKISPGEATRLCLARIDRLNPAFNCFITRLSVPAKAGAADSDRRFASGDSLGPMDGIPVAVKDIIYISGVRCTAGSKILADNIAGYDSPVVRRLKVAGAVLLGTTNLHEFAAGVTSNNPHYGAVRNPWDPKRVAGGSSGGSAAAVASGMVPLALGTDTAGSVRIPAALCGVVGLKPTYGRVSRLGVVPLAPSLDTVGVLASSPWDTAALLQTIAGHEEADPTTVDTPVPDYLSELERPLDSPRVGVLSKKQLGLVDAGVQSAFDAFIERLEQIGWHAEQVDLDGWHEASENWAPIRRAEATAFHLKWLDATPELYGGDVRQLLEKGRDLRAVDYVNAVNSRPPLMQRFAASMANLDFLATPTTRVTAPLVGESSVRIAGEEVSVYPALNSLTLPFNMVGFPVVSIPAGLAQGLPVGAQLVAKPFDEALLLRGVSSYESNYGPFASPPGLDD